MEYRKPKDVSLKRMLVLPAAVLIQTCLGGVYAWSVFVPGLRADYGLTASQTQFTFGLTIGTFSVAMVLAGRLLSTWGARWVGALGGLLFACGQMAASASGGHFLGVVLGYGLIGGAGIGFGYVAALTVAGFMPAAFVVASVLVGFGFGASFVLYAAQVAARYGMNEVGRVYPLLFLAYGAAGITGPLLGGMLHDWTGSCLWPIVASATVAAAGAWWTARAAGTRSNVRLPMASDMAATEHHRRRT